MRRWFVVAFALLSMSGGSAGAAEDVSIVLPTRVVTESVPTDVTTTEVINEIEVGMWYVIRSTVPALYSGRSTGICFDRQWAIDGGWRVCRRAGCP
jgi:hypothetical protein